MDPRAYAFYLIPTIAIVVVALALVAVFAIIAWILWDVKQITEKAKDEAGNIMQDISLLRRAVHSEGAKLANIEQELVRTVSDFRNHLVDGEPKLPLITDLIMRLVKRSKRKHKR